MNLRQRAQGSRIGRGFEWLDETLRQSKRQAVALPVPLDPADLHLEEARLDVVGRYA